MGITHRRPEAQRISLQWDREHIQYVKNIIEHECCSLINNKTKDIKWLKHIMSIARALEKADETGYLLVLTRRQHGHMKVLVDAHIERLKVIEHFTGTKKPILTLVKPLT